MSVLDQVETWETQAGEILDVAGMPSTWSALSQSESDNIGGERMIFTRLREHSEPRIRVAVDVLFRCHTVRTHYAESNIDDALHEWALLQHRVSKHAFWRQRTSAARKSSQQRGQARRDQARELRASGLLHKQIAAELDVSERQVRKYLKN